MSNTTAYDDIIETLAIDPDGNSACTEFFQDDPLKNLTILIICGLVALCLILSVILNLSNISTIAGHFCLRPCGYFHLVALFSAFNIIYFIVEGIRRACELLQEFGLFNEENNCLQLPENTKEFIERHMDPLDELVLNLVGLQILLLCVMTLEHRFNASRHFYFKPKGQNCMRIILTLLVIGLVVGCITLSSFIQRTNLFGMVEERNKNLLPNLVIYAIYILVFTILPVFILVILGVVNCVASWNSTRQNPIEVKLSQNLDRKYAIWATLLILATATELILEMSIKIEAYDHDQLFKLIILGLNVFQYLLLILIPLTTTCVLGNRCCCWCCCKACQPPMDEI